MTGTLISNTITNAEGETTGIWPANTVLYSFDVTIKGPGKIIIQMQSGDVANDGIGGLQWNYGNIGATAINLHGLSPYLG